MTHVRVELGESAPTPRCEECAELPAFFFTPEDGLSLCLQCDLVVHPTSGPGWDRFMIYEQRVRLPKRVMDGKCGGCAGKCKQCRSQLHEAQSAPVRPASPCVTPAQGEAHPRGGSSQRTGPSTSSDALPASSCNVPRGAKSKRADSGEEQEVVKKKARREEEVERNCTTTTTPTVGISEAEPALVAFRSSGD